MPVVTLPDGSTRHYDGAISALEVARSIGSRLGKATIAAEVNGQLVDASHIIDQNCELRFVTAEDHEGLETLRHSCAHLMAQAVKQLYPEAQVTIGPVIRDGFYYDFAYQRPFTPEDLTAIEQRMVALSRQNLPVTRHEWPRDKAIQFFTDLSEHYKAEIISDLPKNETISLYEQGDFIDLCRGPHVPSTSHLKAFKLMKVAGAYWRGDAKNATLQRIYGTAWPDNKALKAHLNRLAEAEKRDHRRLGKQMDLFHMQEEAPGMVFWHDRGWRIYLTIQDYLRQRLAKKGYQEVHTPQVVDRSLWEKSGHWAKFGDEIFTTHSENRDYALKPMNCPCHVQIYNRGLKSYRDLPLRMAEFGSCHRNELSGALHGIMRVRNFVQDDAHIFCTPAQIQQEVSDFIDLVFEVYQDFGFGDVEIALSTRPEQRVGSDAVWDQAEKALAQALERKQLSWQDQPGEGAFYGPKIEFTLRDCLGRGWQCGTIQVDFAMPERLEASYIDGNSQRQVPVMLHRAILGSLERFIGVLIEHHAGWLPLWLAPVQLTVLSITERQQDWASQVAKNLTDLGWQVDLDLRNEKIGYKIREHTLKRSPYLVVIGDREQEQQQITLRSSQDRQDLGTMTVAELHQHLQSLSHD